jgi:predicted nucleotidyltransferase
MDHNRTSGRNTLRLGRLSLKMGYSEDMRLSSVTTDERTLQELCRRNNVSKLSVFGSFARGEDRPGSDIDLLVEFSEPKGLFDLVALEIQLSEQLGRKVDLLTEQSVSPYLRDSIRRDLRVLFDAA